jgi:hypothetical protein
VIRSPFPVTDDLEDAPDGAIVDGFTRSGDTWYPVCPLCEGRLTWGFGLAGGGFGAYEACLDCEYLLKEPGRLPEL